MLHELALHSFNLFGALADGSSGPDATSDGFRIAIVATAGTVISGAFTALAIIVPRHRESSSPPPVPVAVPPEHHEPDPFIVYLQARVDQLEREADDSGKIISGQAAMIERLRDFCWNNRLNPLLFRKMRQGETRENSIAP